MSVTVAEILLASRAGLASLTSETVGYLVLGAADRVVQASPASFDVNDIELDERGTVTVPGIRPAAQDRSESQLRAVLLELLANATQTAPALARVGRGSERGAARLVGEIEAALIPVNRAAARRALARLNRDVSRARASGGLSQIAASAVRPGATSDDPPRAEEIEPCPPAALPRIEVRAEAHPTDVPEVPWEAAPVALIGGSEVHRPEATPFLGGWPVTAVDDLEHDTDHVPPVSEVDATSLGAADRSDVTEITQLLFGSSAEVTQQIPATQPEPAIMAPELFEEEDLDEYAEEVEEEDLDGLAQVFVDVAPIDCTPVVHVECTAREAPPTIGPAWAPIVDADVAPPPAPIADAAPVRAPAPIVESSITADETVVPFELVEARRATLAPTRHKGFTGCVLTPVDEELPSVDIADLLLDGAPVASVPASTESDLLALALEDEPESASSEESPPSDGEPLMFGDIDVTYEDVADPLPVPADAVETANSLRDSDEPSAPIQEALLDWVVRNEELYGEILGIQQRDLDGTDDAETRSVEEDDVAEMDLEQILASEPDDRAQVAVEEILGVQQDDLGEMEWINSEDTLAETPCEVPFAKFDARESYAPKAMAQRWQPAEEIDQDVIDAGWEIDEESPPPLATAITSPPPRAFRTESPTPPPYHPRQSDVSELLAGFTVAETRSLRDMARELKLIAGVGVTPAPPVASPLAAGGGGVETSPPCTSRIWPSSRDS